MELENTSQTKANPQDLAISGSKLLNEIESALIAQGVHLRSPLYRAHFVAIKNWLRTCSASGEIHTLDSIQGYQEAYYHLRAIGDWRQAVEVMRGSLKARKHISNRKWQEFERVVQKVEGNGR